MRLRDVLRAIDLGGEGGHTLSLLVYGTFSISVTLLESQRGISALVYEAMSY
jgi:hypothetical protein